MTSKATAKNKPSLRKSKDADAKKPADKKPEVPYAEEVPPFVYEEGVDYAESDVYDGNVVPPKDEEQIGTVLLVKDPEAEKKRPQPVKLVRKNFPKDLEGESNWWDYKIAICEYRKVQSLRKGDPLKKRKDKLSRMMDAVEALKKKIADEESTEAEAEASEE